MNIADFERIEPHAEWLEKTPRTLLRWCDDMPNGMPYTLVGGTRLFNRAWTLEWIAGNRRQRNPTPPSRRRAA